MNEKNKPHVLVAASPSSGHSLAQTLHNRFTSHTVSSLSNAVTHYGLHIDLVVCSLCFDESRMFDFLRYLNARSAKDVRPFLCVNVQEQLLSESTIRSIDMASRSLGAVGFIDLRRWNGRYGNAGAASKFQDFVEKTLQGT